MASTTVVGHNTQQRPGLRWHPGKGDWNAVRIQMCEFYRVFSIACRVSKPSWVARRCLTVVLCGWMDPVLIIKQALMK